MALHHARRLTRTHTSHLPVVFSSSLVYIKRAIAVMHPRWWPARYKNTTKVYPCIHRRSTLSMRLKQYQTDAKVLCRPYDALEAAQQTLVPSIESTRDTSSEPKHWKSTARAPIVSALPELNDQTTERGIGRADSSESRMRYRSLPGRRCTSATANSLTPGMHLMQA